MSSGLLDWPILERLIIRKANKANRIIPKLSFPLSKGDLDTQIWTVMGVDNTLVAKVYDETVSWADEE